MSKEPGFSKNPIKCNTDFKKIEPDINKRYHNFQYDGEHWVCMSSKQKMIISETAPKFPCKYVYWLNSITDKVSKQSDVALEHLSVDRRGTNRWL